MQKDTQGAASAPSHAGQLNDALLTLKAVRQRTQLSGATIYRMVANGRFPKPLKLGNRCSRWKASDLAAWMAALGEAA